MTTIRPTQAFLIAVFAAVLSAGAAHAEIKTRYVDYKHGDIVLSGFLAFDDKPVGQRPGVLLVHNRRGMSEKVRNDARLIANLGYVVFAVDMFGKGVLPETPAQMTALTRVYDNDRPLMRARAEAGLGVLQQESIVDRSRIAVIGYCFGGTVALELAETGVPVVGTVAVHGSFRNFTPNDAKNIRGSVLILHGAEDQTAPLEEVNSLIAQLRAAKVDWQLELYSGAEHGFTEPATPSEERADREYKATTERFFKEIFRH